MKPSDVEKQWGKDLVGRGVFEKRKITIDSQDKWETAKVTVSRPITNFTQFEEEKFRDLCKFTEEEGFDADRWFSFLSQSLKHQREMMVAELKKIATWPEPYLQAGMNIGPLFASGLLTQYKNDKNRHEKEVQGILKALEQ